VATKFCPECGDEFVAAADTCPDCEVGLVDERPVEIDSDKKGQTTYELHEWAVESRVMLESLLTGQKVPHAWEGTNLQVAAAFESKVDALIDQVEITTEPNLDPEAPKVAYDLAEWDDEQQTDLLQALDGQGVPYDFDVDGSLVVLESDDPVVEGILDQLAGPDEDADDEDVAADEETEVEADAVVAGDDAGAGEPGGDDAADDVLDNGEDLDAQAVMTDLFVASDRLRKKAADHQGILTLVERAGDAERMRLPFGFNRHDWEQIVQQATKLRDLIEDDDAKDDDIEAHAAILRGTLRPYV
jgi:hypothetical protein